MRTKECSCCGKGGLSRQGAGPTGRKKQWMVRVDCCSRCGYHYPANPEDMTYEQTEWIRRWNKRCKEQYNKEPPREPTKYYQISWWGTATPDLRSINDTRTW